MIGRWVRTSFEERKMKRRHGQHGRVEWMDSGVGCGDSYFCAFDAYSPYQWFVARRRPIRNQTSNVSPTPPPARPRPIYSDSLQTRTRPPSYPYLHTPPVEAACILCRVAADMCYEIQADQQSRATYDDRYNNRLKGKCREGINVLGMVTLNDLDMLRHLGRGGRGWDCM